MEPTTQSFSWGEFVPVIRDFLPQLVAAVVILVLGWVVAAFIARGVRAGIRRSGISRRVAGWVAGEDTVSRDVEVWSGRIVFWLAMLLVLVGFFQVLGLNQITEPLLGLLNEVFTYAPRLLGPAVLVVVAWVVAKVLQLLVQRVLTAARLDERLRSEAEVEGERSVVHTISDAVYWVTLLLFLPAILYALNIGGLLEPVRSMIDKFLVYLPNLFAAGVILLVGWLVARILRRVIASGLAAVGTDRLSEQVGLRRALGQQSLSELVGLLVYILILVPVIVAGLNALELDAVTAPASEMLNAFLAAIPKLFAAGLVLAIAWIVGRIVAGLVENLLRGLGFDSLPARLGLRTEAAPPETGLSRATGQLVLVAILIFATVEALRLIEFDAVAQLGSDFLVFAGRILVGVAIIGFGLFIARLAADAIRATSIPRANLIAVTARVSIIILAVAMGLGQMGLAEEIIAIAFGILFGAIALAAAIAFGLGGRETAGQLFEDWVQSVTGRSRE